MPQHTAPAVVRRAGGGSTREFAAAAALVVSVAVLRGVAFLVWEHASFDSDQAVTGLMAKHLIEGRAFPLFYYGQNYLLAVQAWLAAPVFLATGPTVAALKLPLVLLNATTALVLLRVLSHDLGLRPWLAVMASAFFVAAPPGTAAQLVSALGASVEPFLYVLLIWLLRDRPLWQGTVLGVGFLQREFTAYGFVAFVAVLALDGTLFSRARAAKIAAALAAAIAVWLAVAALRPFSSGAGPGTTPLDVAGAGNNLRGLLDRVCTDPSRIASGFVTLLGSYLGLPLGLTPARVSGFLVNSRLDQGLTWAWPVFAAGCLAGLVRAAVLARRRGVRATMRDAGAAIYLVVVGALAAAGYTVGRCGDLQIETVRYVLLALLMPIGLAGAWLRLEPRPAIRAAIVGVIAAWSAVSVAGHARLVNEYVRDRPPAYRRALTDYLVQHRIRLVRTDYWTGYQVAFLSQERVVADTDGVWRVLQYHRWAEQRPHAVWYVGRGPCANRGEEAVPGVYWVCDPPD